MERETPENGQATQYNNLSVEYASLAEVDPVKRFIQYPEALRLLGDVANKDILDIGCGNGTFTRMLARKEARVVGYDPAVKQIEEAQKFEAQEGSGIKYFVGDRPAISPGHQFDEAVSVMVLLYATGRGNLRDIFTYAIRALKSGGSFSSITFNPDYRRFGEVAYNRRFSKTEDGRIQVDFLNDQGEVKITARFSDFSVSDYENAAKEAGFSGVEWIKLEITPEGKEKQGEDFWNDFEDDPPYIGIRVVGSLPEECC